MAFLSEILNEPDGIPDFFKEQASYCCCCKDKISSGGMWVLYIENGHLGICKKCAPSLLDWYIDTLLDTGAIDENDDIEDVMKLSNDIIGRYKRKKEQKIKWNKKHL